MTARFRANQHVQDLHIIDMLRYKCEAEIDEAIKLFKCPSHVYKIIAPADDVRSHIASSVAKENHVEDKSDFLKQFLQH